MMINLATIRFSLNMKVVSHIKDMFCQSKPIIYISTRQTFLAPSLVVQESFVRPTELACPIFLGFKAIEDTDLNFSHELMKTYIWTMTNK